jgi:hypothetical protein
MRVRVRLAAHSNEFATVNKDGASFMNVRAALSCIGKLVLIFLKNLLKRGVPFSWLLPFVISRIEVIIKKLNNSYHNVNITVGI